MGLPNVPAISPRPLSGRVRGVQAPHVRTSLSPDLVLRRRRHVLRRRAQVRKQLKNANPEDIIEIFSESEADEPPASTSVPSTHNDAPSTNTLSQEQVVGSSTQPASQASTICTRRADELLHLPTVKARSSVGVKESHKPAHRSESYRKRSSQSTRRYGSTLRTGPIMSQQPWFRVCMSQLRKMFPELLCDTTETHIMCMLCDPAQPFAAGPGDTLDAFSRHLRLVHFSSSEEHATQKGHFHDIHNGHDISASAAEVPKGDVDVVVEFLVENGLSPNLARMLKAVGITDRKRMRMLGTLPDTELDRLDQQLVKQGMDFVALVLVREGLRRCTRAGIQ